MERDIPVGSIEVKDPQSTAVCYKYSLGDGTPCVIYYMGNQTTRRRGYRFKNELQREGWIKSYFQKVQEMEARKEVRKKEKKHNSNMDIEMALKEYKVGDIFVSSWGYDQTNIDFFQIIEKKAKTFVMRELESQTVYTTGFMEGEVVPVRDKFKGKPFKKVLKYGYTSHECGALHLWDYKPQRESHYH